MLFQVRNKKIRFSVCQNLSTLLLKSSRVTESSGPSRDVLIAVRKAMINIGIGTVQLIRRPFPTENILGIADELQLSRNITPTKSYVWWMNDPWAAFIALSAIIILLGIIAVIILLYQWNRYVLLLYCSISGIGTFCYYTALPVE